MKSIKSMNTAYLKQRLDELKKMLAYGNEKEDTLSHLKHLVSEIVIELKIRKEEQTNED